MLEVILEEYPCLEKLNKLNTLSGVPLQSTPVTWDKSSHSWKTVRWEKALDVEVQPLHNNICQVLGEEDFLISSENSILVYRPLRKHWLYLNFENYLTLTQPFPERGKNSRSKILYFQQHVSSASLLEACSKHGEPFTYKSFPLGIMDFTLKLTAFKDPPPTLCSCLAASTLVIWNKGWYFKMLWLACTILLSIFCTNVAATLHMAAV